MQPINFGPIMQVVLSELSGHVAQWLLKDASPLQHQPQQPEVALFGSHTNSNMLSVQLAANMLAQRAG